MVEGKAVVVDAAFNNVRPINVYDGLLNPDGERILGLNEWDRDTLDDELEGELGPPILSPLTLALPKADLALTPSEANTVVLLKWGSQLVGAYGEEGGGFPAQKSAYVISCEVTVINERSQAVSRDHASFLGPMPPRKLNGAMDASPVYGDPPLGEIVHYIGSLMAKQRKADQSGHS